MQPIIIDNEPNNVYHSKLTFHSSTRLKLMAKSPLHFRNYGHDIETKDDDKKETAAMLLGTITHSLVLEPKDFDSQYVVMPKMDRRTKQGKEEFEAFEFKNRGKLCIDSEMFNTASKMAASVLKNSKMVKWLNEGIIEQSMYWEDELTGVKLRARPDIRYKNIIIDLKTNGDASPSGAAKSSAQFDYPLSAAQYTDGVDVCLGNITEFYLFCFVEKVEPFDCMIYRLPEEDLEKARARRREYIHKIAECEASGLWPGYESNPLAVNGIMEMKLPGYYYNK